jgi:hypothetical protein
LTLLLCEFSPIQPYYKIQFSYIKVCSESLRNLTCLSSPVQCQIGEILLHYYPGVLTNPGTYWQTLTFETFWWLHIFMHFNFTKLIYKIISFACPCTFVCKQTHTHAHTHAHTCAHTYTHTYTRTYTHIRPKHTQGCCTSHIPLFQHLI